MTTSSIPTRVAQSGDSTEALLAKLLGAPLSGVSLVSAARTATTVGSTIETNGFRRILVHLNCTAASGTGGLVVTLQTEDPVSGTWRNYVNASNGITTAVYVQFTIGQYAGPLTNMGFNSTSQGMAGVALPPRFRIGVVHLDASSYTYSLAYDLLP